MTCCQWTRAACLIAGLGLMVAYPATSGAETGEATGDGGADRPVALFAPDYPERDVTVAVADGPGSSDDLQIRLIALLADGADFLEQSLTVVNHPGDGGEAAWSHINGEVAADGYAVMVARLPDLLLRDRLDTVFEIDPPESGSQTVEPLVAWTAEPLVLVTHRDSSITTLDALLDSIRSGSGEPTVIGGTRLHGSAALATLQLAEATGVPLVYHPSEDGSLPALGLLERGRIDALFLDLSTVYRHQNTLNTLAVADTHRAEMLLPDAPTFEELGVGVDDLSLTYRTIVAPGDAPEPAKRFLQERFPRLLSYPSMQMRMEETGSQPRIVGREQLGEMADELADRLDDFLDSRSIDVTLRTEDDDGEAGEDSDADDSTDDNGAN